MGFLFIREHPHVRNALRSSTSRIRGYRAPLVAHRPRCLPSTDTQYAIERTVHRRRAGGMFRRPVAAALLTQGGSIVTAEQFAERARESARKSAAAQGSRPQSVIRNRYAFDAFCCAEVPMSAHEKGPASGSKRDQFQVVPTPKGYNVIHSSGCIPLTTKHVREGVR